MIKIINQKSFKGGIQIQSRNFGIKILVLRLIQIQLMNTVIVHY